MNRQTVEDKVTEVLKLGSGTIRVDLNDDIVELIMQLLATEREEIKKVILTTLMSDEIDPINEEGLKLTYNLITETSYQ